MRIRTFNEIIFILVFSIIAHQHQDCSRRSVEQAQTEVSFLLILLFITLFSNVRPWKGVENSDTSKFYYLYATQDFYIVYLAQVHLKNNVVSVESFKLKQLV